MTGAQVADAADAKTVADARSVRPVGPPRVGVIMGSRSDWPIMELASQTLGRFGVSHECRVISAHRTPDEMFAYAEGARGRGLQVIIAGAGGAAHLPGMVAAKTHVPVLGVPIPSKALSGVDSLLSICQMPRGVPVATFAIGEAGAINAALMAIEILALGDPPLAEALAHARRAERAQVIAEAEL